MKIISIGILGVKYRQGWRARPWLVLCYHPIGMKLAQAPQKARLHGRSALFFSVAAFVLALDQATKELVRATLERGDFWPSADWAVRIHHVTNTGAAFGILKDQTGFLIVTTFIGLAAILLYYRFPPYDHILVPLAVGMMLGGAMGNLADRIRLGRVTDFIDFPLWPAFNVADSSIVVAVVVLLAAYTLLQPRRTEERPALDTTDDDPGADGR